MVCKNCGKEVNDNVRFCGFCGSKLEKNIILKDQNKDENDIELEQNDDTTKIDKPSSKANRNVKAKLRDPKKGLPIVFLTGLIIGIALSYVTWITPYQAKTIKQIKHYLSEKDKYVSLKKQAESDIKNAKAKQEEAEDYYRKVNGLKNEAGEPKETRVIGEAVVGKDIAPGNYQMQESEDAFYAYQYNLDGEKIWEEYMWRETAYLNLKVGDKVIIEAGHLAVLKPI